MLLRLILGMPFNFKIAKERTPVDRSLDFMIRYRQSDRDRELML